MSISNYDMTVFYFVLILGIVVSIVFIKKTKEWQNKMIYAFLIGGTTIYSGLGIAAISVDNSYIMVFLLFIIFEGIGLSFGFRTLRNKKESPRTDAIEKISNSNLFINAIAIAYWLIIIVLLLYPENHLGSLFSVKLDISGVFENRIARRTNNITYILELFSTLLLPYYCIYLSKQKKTTIIALLLVEKYLNAVTNSYIGRTALMMLVVQIIAIVIIIDSPSEGRLKLKRIRFVLGSRGRDTGEDDNTDAKTKYNKRLKTGLIVLAIGFVIAIPFLASYQFTRQGKTFTDTGFSGALMLLLESEINYPKHYLRAENLVGEVITPLQYLYWLITLPIPKEIISLPRSISINNAYSSILTGVSYGARGFSISLVSLLGEGILLWGKYFSFIHGFTIGYVWGVMNSYCNRHKELLLFQIMFIAKTLNMVRGGSQGSIANMGNSIIPFIVVTFVVHNLSRRKENSL